MDLYRLLYGFDWSIVWFCIDYYLDLYWLLSRFVSTYIWTAYVIVYLIGVIYTPFIKKTGWNPLFAVCQGQGTRQTCHSLPCAGTGHTSKRPLFAVCRGQGTRQTGCVCRVPGPEHTANRLFNAVFSDALYFIVSLKMHTVKCLPCARNVAHGELALCRPLYAGSYFAVCPWHTTNGQCPIVTATICKNAPILFKSGSKFNPLLQIKSDYCSNWSAIEKIFLGTGHPYPPLQIIFKFILKIH